MKDEAFYEDISSLVASVSTRTLRMKTNNVKLLNRIGFELNHILAKMNDIVRIYQADKNEFINDVELIQRDYIDLSRKIDERFSQHSSCDEAADGTRRPQSQTNLQRILNTSNSSMDAHREDQSPTPTKLKKKKKKHKASPKAGLFIPDTCAVDEASYTPRKVADEFVVRETVDGREEAAAAGVQMADRFEKMLSDLEKSQEDSVENFDMESVKASVPVGVAGRRLARAAKSPRKGASSTPLAVRKELQAHGLLDLTNEQDSLNSQATQESMPAPPKASVACKRPDKTKTPVKFLMLDRTPNKSPSLIFKSVADAKPTVSTFKLAPPADQRPAKKVYTPSTDKTFKSQFDMYNEIPSPAKKQPAAKKQRLKQLTMSQAFAGQSTKAASAALTTTPAARPNDLDETCLTTQFDSPQVKFAAHGPVKTEPMECGVVATTAEEEIKSQLRQVKPEPVEEEATILSPCEQRRSPPDAEFFADFDKVPKKKDDGPGFKHVSVVRKHDERKKLSASACRECENYWNSLPEEKRPQRMEDMCRHRAKYQPPSTPEHYWSISFPNTQDCIERGYGGVLVEAESPSSTKRPRRKRPLKLESRKRKGGEAGVGSPDNSDFDFGDAD